MVGVVLLSVRDSRTKNDKFLDSLSEMGQGMSHVSLESALLTPKEFERYNRPDEEKSNKELAEEIILITQRSSERFGSKRRRTMVYDDAETPGP